MVDGKFACEACGKKYTWKPQLAGKRAKCACGAQIVVPAAQGAAKEPDDLYDMAKPAVAEGTVAPTSAMVSAPPPPVTLAPSMRGVVAPAPAGGVAYRSAATAQDGQTDRFSFDRMTHPPRDLYVPVGLLIAGFVAILAWAAIAADAGAAGMIIMSVLTGAITLIKLVVLIPMAMIVAPMFGISFGDFRTAVLKFAAIIVFTDAVVLWIEHIMEAAGGAPASGRMAGRMILVTLLASAAFISFLSHYLFDMDGEETGYFALPMALLSWLMSLVMGSIVVGVIEGLAAAAAAPPPAPAPAPPAGTVASGGGAQSVAAPAPRPVMIRNESDREIVGKIEPTRA